MTVLAEAQSTSSFEAFQAGLKRKKEADPRLIENAYANKKQKLNNRNESAGRGRFGFDQLGILRTKPGNIHLSFFFLLRNKHH
jgi:tRNA-specific adenosine deaminase 1